MFSSSCALSSPASVGSFPPLFGRFTGTTTQSDFSNACMSVVRLYAFPNRPSQTAEGTLEISRFSCMLSPSACAGSNDYAGPDSNSRYRNCRIAFLHLGRESASCSTGFSKLNHPAHKCLRPTLRNSPRDGFRKTRGQDGVAVSFPVGILPPLQHAGLSRRSPIYRSRM